MMKVLMSQRINTIKCCQTKENSLQNLGKTTERYEIDIKTGIRMMGQSVCFFGNGVVMFSLNLDWSGFII